MKSLSVVLILLFVTGCAGLDSVLSTRGKVTVDYSDFDGKKVVRMTPALTNHGLSLHPEFGLYWQDGYENLARLVVDVQGTHSFVRTKPLELMIDGTRYVLKPWDSGSFGDIHYDSVLQSNISSKDYEINKELIEKIANAKSGAYKLYFRDGYQDGKITYKYTDYDSYIQKPFKKFANLVWP